MNAKLKKYLLLLAVPAMLLVSSCSGVNTEDESVPVGENGSIRVSLGDSVARTILPVLGEGIEGNAQLDKYTWKLEGESDSITRKWIWRAPESDSSADSDAIVKVVEKPFTTLSTSVIGMPAGTWHFTLTATLAGTKKDENHDKTTVTTFVGNGFVGSGESETADVEVSAGAASKVVTFKMALTALDVAVEGRGAFSISVNWTSTDVKKVTAGLYELPAADATTLGSLVYGDNNAETDITDAKKFEATGINAGTYIAQFTFFDAAGNKLGNPPWEYVYIGSDTVSEGSISVTNLDEVYHIIYNPVPTLPSGTLSASFTRNTTSVSLPTAAMISEAGSFSGYYFCGWYKDAEFTEQVDANSYAAYDVSNIRSDITLYARLIPQSSARLGTDTSVPTITYGGTGENQKAAVGNTATASGVTGSYQWYTVKDGNEQDIQGATNASYKITANEDGKTLRVKVTPAYKVTKVTDDGLEDGSVLYYKVSAGEPVASTPTNKDTVAPGSFSGTPTLQYSGTVIYGSKPVKSNIVIGSILTDVYGNTVTGVDADFEDYSVLTKTTALNVTFTVSGYSGPSGSSSPTVVVPVKYAIPASNIVKLAVLTENSPGVTLDNGSQITLTGGNTVFQTISTDAALQYKIAGSSGGWTDVVYGTQFPATAGSKLWVRIKGVETAEVDKVIASEPIVINVTSSNIYYESGSGSGGGSNPPVVSREILMDTGSNINAIFKTNFRMAKKFMYTTDSAPSNAVTISDTGSAVEVKAWLKDDILYVHADDFSGEYISAGETVTAKYYNMIPLNADCSGLFANMRSLTSIDLSAFNTRAVTNMSAMFQGCSSLTEITFGDGFNASNVTDMSSMFETTKLTSLDIGDLGIEVEDEGTPALKNISGMFVESEIKTIDMSKLNTSAVEDMSFLFSYAVKLESVTFGGSFSTASVKDMSYMFMGTALSTVDISGFVTTSVETMSNMFAEMKNLQVLDLSSFNLNGVCYDVSCMFSGDTELTKIYVGSNSDWTDDLMEVARSGNKGPYGDDMFLDCESLVGGGNATYSITRTDYTYANTSDTGYFTAKTSSSQGQP
ncbi:BspA family leucine-rich repeat surface protein [uncultured Treponema sp.]|uniref:BspA family leucine-rich repeat surface protein n=1 Tax=uncultured Treponema sp. TaxID=162155 RepID=UPI0025DDDFF4|nr:BspA family leucine-rich repeat surface protein [uncultured Treponema sp.]